MTTNAFDKVMLRWHLQEGRSAIPKSTQPARIAENFDVFDFELSEEDVAAIDALDTEFGVARPRQHYARNVRPEHPRSVTDVIDLRPEISGLMI